MEDKSILAMSVKEYANDRTQDNYDSVIRSLYIGLTKNASLILPATIELVNSEPIITPAMIQATDGKWYYVVFTCGDETQKCDTPSFVEMKIEKLLDKVVNDDEMGGFVLDPYNDANCFVMKEYADEILSTWKEDKE